MRSNPMQQYNYSLRCLSKLQGFAVVGRITSPSRWFLDRIACKGLIEWHPMSSLGVLKLLLMYPLHSADGFRTSVWVSPTSADHLSTVLGACPYQWLPLESLDKACSLHPICYICKRIGCFLHMIFRLTMVVINFPTAKLATSMVQCKLEMSES